VQQMLRAIVGIQIPVDKLIGKWKVSQNRSATDRLGVSQGLAEETANPQAAAMSRLVPVDPGS
jgi:transcriptional regulator